MKTKKIDLGQMLTIGANFGVVVGIIFLAVELQQNNQLLETQVRRDFYEGRIMSASDFIRDASLAEIVLKSAAGEELTEVENFRMGQVVKRVLLAWEWEFDQYQRGLLDALPVVGWRATIRNSELGPSTWEIMATTSFAHTPEFVQFMEENVLNDL